MGIRRRIGGLTGAKSLLLTQAEGTKLNKHGQKNHLTVSIFGDLDRIHADAA